MGKIAAFFDIDGTLYRDSLMVEHFKKLIKYDIIDQKAWFEHARDTFMDWDKRQGHYDDYLDEICDLYVKSLIGLDKTCIDFTSDQVIKLKSDRVYKYTRSRIKWHLDNNHIVIFISGSPGFLVEKMAKKYNKTVAQIILRWHIQEGIIVFPRSTQKEHLAENINIFDFELSCSEIKEIRKLNKKQHYFTMTYEEQEKNFLSWKLED